MPAWPNRQSYRFDILPIFQRLAGLQWVNAGFAAGFGWKGLNDFTNAAYLKELGKNCSSTKELRNVISNQFRNYSIDSWSPKPWPWIYGDAVNIPAAHTPLQNSALSDLQLVMLKQWADGDFESDYDDQYKPPTSIDEVPLIEQGETLTRAALEFCLADAFHPGCEMTWPVRTPSMFMQPFRFAHHPAGVKEPALGKTLTYLAASVPNGPLYGQVAGGISQWMAVPWQADTASCRSGYEPAYDPYVPAFWPARVPNQVLTKENYAVVMDSTKPLDERLAAFAKRASWIDPLGPGDQIDQINKMIVGVDHLGVVEVLPGPSDVSAFPAEIEVEDQHVPITSTQAPAASATSTGSSAASASTARARPTTTTVHEDYAILDKLSRFRSSGR